MCSQSQTGTTEWEGEWEPEQLPLVEQLEYPPPLPRREDAHESDQSSRIVVIDLA